LIFFEKPVDSGSKVNKLVAPAKAVESSLGKRRKELLGMEEFFWSDLGRAALDLLIENQVVR
jgi:hypothetical protein